MADYLEIGQNMALPVVLSKELQFWAVPWREQCQKRKQVVLHERLIVTPRLSQWIQLKYIVSAKWCQCILCE